MAELARGKGFIGLDADSEAESYVLSGTRVAMFGMRAPEGAERLDCRGAAIVPGFVNAHTHLYSGLAPLGMPEPREKPRSFVEILERVWWRLDRALDEESLRAAARLYVAEALLAGTTTLVDHHESPGFVEGSLDVLAEACDELGVRAVLAYGATERNGGQDEAMRGLAECARFLVKNRRPRVDGMVGVHAGFTVSDETLREAGDMARRVKAPLHLHVAEDPIDVQAAKERGYDGPVHRLRELGALVPGSILAHGVHLDERELVMAAEARCWLVHNPRSNAHNGVGAARLKAAGDRVALGTDGFPADMLDEVAGWQKAAEADPQADRPDPRRLAAGVRLVGERFGTRFAPPMAGTVADLVVLETERREKAKVRHVVVDGRIVVKDGALTTGDLARIRDEAALAAPALWARMEKLAAP